MPIVWINRKLYNFLIEETVKKLPLETGGMLLGYKDIYCDIVITDLIGPGPKAKYARDSFIPDGKYQQIELSRIYFESARLKTYLGDWHSHPYENSHMSFADHKTLIKIAKTKSARVPNPIFIIVGTKSYTPRCWRYNGNINPNTELTEIKIY